MARLNETEPLNLEFEAGRLVKVDGARPEYMDGYSLLQLVRKLAQSRMFGDAAEMDRRGAVIEKLEREKSEALAYLKAFIFATIDPADKRADVQVHQANPALGWYFTLNDTGIRGHREILGSQIRRAMEIVGFDRLKIEPPSTTVADEHIAADLRALKAEMQRNLLLAAAKAISDRNGSYVGHDIIISCESHGDALRLMRDLRDAIAKAEGRQ